MSELSITVDLKEFRRKMGAYANQAPYVLSKTINAAMLDSQKDVTPKFANWLNVRRPNFIKRSVKIGQFSKKTTLTGIIGIGNVGGKPTSDILAKFEKPSVKVSHTGGRIAIPTKNVKVSGKGIIAKSQRPKNLKRSFLLTTKKGQHVIFQRKGKGKRSDIQAMYVLKHSAQINDRTDFQSYVSHHILTNLGARFEDEFLKAIKTAR